MSVFSCISGLVFSASVTHASVFARIYETLSNNLPRVFYKSLLSSTIGYKQPWSGARPINNTSPCTCLACYIDVAEFSDPTEGFQTSARRSVCCENTPRLPPNSYISDNAVGQPKKTIIARIICFPLFFLPLPVVAPQTFETMTASRIDTGAPA